jgi:hypothetical protein
MGSMPSVALLEDFQGLEDLGHIFVFEGYEGEEFVIKQMDSLLGWQLILPAEYLHLLMLKQF